MNARRIISFCLITLVAVPAVGQGRQVLTDGISGRDLANDMQFIQAFSPKSDTCLVVTDSLGLFEIEPAIMERMPGNVYLKPIRTRPKPKLVLNSPFDSIHVYSEGRDKYLSQNRLFEPDQKESVFYYVPQTTLLKESTVRARRLSIARDKVTSYLDSLSLLASPEWVC